MGNEQSGGGGSADVEKYTGKASDLAGEWVPTRHDEWKNRNIGLPHKARAKMPQTKMKYKANGKGEGWVGDLYVYVKTVQRVSLS